MKNTKQNQSHWKLLRKIGAGILTLTLVLNYNTLMSFFSNNSSEQKFEEMMEYDESSEQAIPYQYQNRKFNTNELSVFGANLTRTYEEERTGAIEEKLKEEKEDRKEILLRLKEKSIEEILENKNEKTKEIIEELKEKGAITTMISKNGREKEIKPDLTISLDGYFKTRETPYKTKIPLESRKAVVISEEKKSNGETISGRQEKRIAEDKTPEVEEEVRYYSRNANAVDGQRYNNKALYENIWNETDLLITTTEEGIKEDLILKNSNAPTYFDYIVETIGMTLEITEEGGFAFKDENGEKKFYTPSPEIIDARGKRVTEGVIFKLGWDFIDRSQTIAKRAEKKSEEEKLPSKELTSLLNDFFVEVHQESQTLEEDIASEEESEENSEVDITEAKVLTEEEKKNLENLLIENEFLKKYLQKKLDGEEIDADEEEFIRAFLENITFEDAPQEKENTKTGIHASAPEEEKKKSNNPDQGILFQEYTNAQRYEKSREMAEMRKARMVELMQKGLYVSEDSIKLYYDEQGNFQYVDLNRNGKIDPEEMGNDYGKPLDTTENKTESSAFLMDLFMPTAKAQSLGEFMKEMEEQEEVFHEENATEIETFEHSREYYEEDIQYDGSVIRRYKIRLLIETEKNALIIPKSTQKSGSKYEIDGDGNLTEEGLESFNRTYERNILFQDYSDVDRYQKQRELYEIRKERMLELMEKGLYVSSDSLKIYYETGEFKMPEEPVHQTAPNTPEEEEETDEDDTSDNTSSNDETNDTSETGENTETNNTSEDDTSDNDGTNDTSEDTDTSNTNTEEDTTSNTNTDNTSDPTNTDTTDSETNTTNNDTSDNTSSNDETNDTSETGENTETNNTSGDDTSDNDGTNDTSEDTDTSNTNTEEDTTSNTNTDNTSDPTNTDTTDSETNTTNNDTSDNTSSNDETNDTSETGENTETNNTSEDDTSDNDGTNDTSEDTDTSNTNTEEDTTSNTNTDNTSDPTNTDTTDSETNTTNNDTSDNTSSNDETNDTSETGENTETNNTSEDDTSDNDGTNDTSEDTSGDDGNDPEINPNTDPADGPVALRQVIGEGAMASFFDVIFENPLPNPEPLSEKRKEEEKEMNLLDLSFGFSAFKSSLMHLMETEEEVDSITNDKLQMTNEELEDGSSKLETGESPPDKHLQQTPDGHKGDLGGLENGELDLQTEDSEEKITEPQEENPTDDHLETQDIVSLPEKPTLTLKDGTILKYPLDLDPSTFIATRVIPKETVSSGDNHTLALKSDGSVWAWGDNSLGQLGDNQNCGAANCLLPTQVSNIAEITSISAGAYHSLALDADGNVWAWGENISGQLGNDTTTQQNIPVQVKDTTGTGSLSNIIAISAGDSHSLALDASGTVWAWGNNTSGELGDNQNCGTANCLLPIQVTTIIDIIAIDAGAQSSFALKSNGSLLSWGNNTSGQLGDNSTTQRNIPVAVKDTTGTVNLLNITDVSVGENHTVALDADGVVWAWGDNSFGQIGDNQTCGATSCLLPIAVKDSVGTGFLSGIQEVSAGRNHTLAKGSDSTLWAWGDNSSGQLGDNTTVQRNLPVQVLDETGTAPLGNIVTTSAGAIHSVALSSDGSIWTWGGNTNGQLGENTTSQSSLPIQGIAPSGGSDLFLGIGSQTIADGDSHSLFIRYDGTVWAWGDNSSGQLGDNSTTQKSYPVQVLGTGGSGKFQNAYMAAAGNGFSLILKDDGTVWSWGKNDKGQLGDNQTCDSTFCKTPVQVDSLTNVIMIVAKGNHALALKDDGSVWAWGDNTSGQLGDNTTSQRNAPIQVKDFTGNNFLQDIALIGSGTSHSLAITTDGTGVAWGANASGQLGDNSTTQRLLPVRIKNETASGFLENITDISGGDSHTALLTSDGSIYAWGDNSLGQVGDAGSCGTSCNLPVSVSGLSDMTQIETGKNHTIALSSSGAVYAWGANTNGQVGDNTIVEKNTPQQVKDPAGTGLLASMTSISAGGNHSSAVKADGTVWKWGANANGQIGNNISGTDAILPTAVVPLPPKTLNIDETDAQSGTSGMEVILTSATPVFSAIFDDISDDIANKYEIEVDDTSDFSSPVWQSGSQNLTTNIPRGSRSENITYSGISLTASTEYFWRMKLTDNGGTSSPWNTAVSSFIINGAPTAPTTLHTDGSDAQTGTTGNQVAVDSATPVFSAIYNDNDSGDIANAYQLQVDDNSDFSSPVWDSTQQSITDVINGDRTEDIPYAGPALSPNLEYFYRIKFWDQNGVEGVWSSESASFLFDTPPEIPTIVSPVDGDTTSNDMVPLSAHYTDTDAADMGLTHYRISDSAANCLSDTNVVAFGSSTETTTNDEDTSWTPTASIGTDGDYYWCAQNDDGIATSPWTSMGSFTLDTSIPDIVAIDAGKDDTDRTNLESGIWFNDAVENTGEDATISFSWTDPNSASDDTFYYELNTLPGESIDETDLSTTDPFVDDIVLTEGTNYFHVKPQTGGGTWGIERTFEIKYDNTAPTVSVLTPNGTETIGGDTEYEITWNASDTTSDIATDGILIEYALTDGVWTEIASEETNDGSYLWVTPWAEDAGAQVRITATDAAGNIFTDESDAVFTIEQIFDTLEIAQGNNQIGELGVTLGQELTVEAKTASGQTAGAGDITVDFEIITVPQNPIAENQELQLGALGQNATQVSPTNITVETDANGHASVLMKLGDRAGEYIVRAKYDDGAGEIVQDFSLTEVEMLNAKFGSVSINMNNISGGNRSSAETNISLLSNASSFAVYANITDWPQHVSGSSEINNWDANISRGFGWKKTNDFVTNSFDGAAQKTKIYECQAAQNCQGMQNIGIQFDSAIGYDTRSGLYSSNVTFTVEDVVY